MARHWTLLLSALICCAAQVAAQNSKQNFTFQVSPDQLWVDTGLDLASGDAVEISAAASTPMQSGLPACVPEGVGAAAADLPLASAPAGAVIARLHAQGAAPLLVGAQTKLSIAEPSHLFVGMNVAGTPPCTGAIAVFVRRIAANASAAASAGEGQQKSRSEQLKSQLGNAAEIFMAGQFGCGKTDSSGNAAGGAASGNNATAANSAAATPLKVSDAPLEGCAGRA